MRKQTVNHINIQGNKRSSNTELQNCRVVMTAGLQWLQDCRMAGLQNCNDYRNGGWQRLQDCDGCNDCRMAMIAGMQWTQDCRIAMFAISGHKYIAISCIPIPWLHCWAELPRVHGTCFWDPFWDPFWDHSGVPPPPIWICSFSPRLKRTPAQILN